MGLKRVLFLICFLSFDLLGAKLDKLTISINSHPLVVEIADTPAKRAKGLMWRDNLSKHRGMLFIFEKAAPYKFWMKNTFIPLSIAFLDRNKKIIMLADMSANDLTPIGPDIKILYALEVNRGWFAKKGIVLGDKMVIIKKSNKNIKK